MPSYAAPTIPPPTLSASAPRSEIVKASAGLAEEEGRRGWACLTWPKEYGGRGATSDPERDLGTGRGAFRTPPNIFGIGHRHVRPDDL